jgi:hypothetical protein
VSGLGAQKDASESGYLSASACLTAAAGPSATPPPRSKALPLEQLEALADALLDFHGLTTWLAAKALSAPGRLPTEPPAPHHLQTPYPLPHFPIHHLASPLQKVLSPLRSQEPHPS